jgi:ribosome maturation factor RimP
MVSSDEYDALLGTATLHARQHGAEVIDLVVRGDRMHRVIELFVDSETGVTLDLCQEISRSLVQEIEKNKTLAGSYRLDVSSPGLDRPLKFPWQYRKHAGHVVQVVVDRSGTRETVHGKLLGADEYGLEVQTGKGPESRRIAFNTVIETRVKTPW